MERYQTYVLAALITVLALSGAARARGATMMAAQIPHSRATTPLRPRGRPSTLTVVPLCSTALP